MLFRSPTRVIKGPVSHRAQRHSNSSIAPAVTLITLQRSSPGRLASRRALSNPARLSPRDALGYRISSPVPPPACPARIAAPASSPQVDVHTAALKWWYDNHRFSSAGACARGGEVQWGRESDVDSTWRSLDYWQLSPRSYSTLVGQLSLALPVERARLHCVRSPQLVACPGISPPFLLVLHPAHPAHVE